MTWSEWVKSMYHSVCCKGFEVVDMFDISLIETNILHVNIFKETKIKNAMKFYVVDIVLSLQFI